jgi:hypothetical protein
MNLPQKNKILRSKTLENELFNPKKIDIFTEAEATYNCSLLKSKEDLDSSEKRVDDQTLDLLHKKAIRTLQVLNEEEDEDTI